MLIEILYFMIVISLLDSSILFYLWLLFWDYELFTFSSFLFSFVYTIFESSSLKHILVFGALLVFYAMYLARLTVMARRVLEYADIFLRFTLLGFPWYCLIITIYLGFHTF